MKLLMREDLKELLDRPPELGASIYMPTNSTGDTVEGQRLNVVGFPGQAERQTQDECGGQLPVEFHVPILPRLNLNSQPREVAA